MACYRNISSCLATILIKKITHFGKRSPKATRRGAKRSPNRKKDPPFLFLAKDPPFWQKITQSHTTGRKKIPQSQKRSPFFVFGKRSPILAKDHPKPHDGAQKIIRHVMQPKITRLRNGNGAAGLRGFKPIQDAGRKPRGRNGAIQSGGLIEEYRIGWVWQSKSRRRRGSYHPCG